MSALLREPLVQFFAAGVLLFGLWALIGDDSAPSANVITVAPDAPESEILDEVLFREALALGLNETDGEVRALLIERMRALIVERQPPEEPGEADLKAWFEEHRARFVDPEAEPQPKLYERSREKVMRDWVKHRRELAAERALRELRDTRYVIRREPAAAP